MPNIKEQISRRNFLRVAGAAAGASLTAACSPTPPSEPTPSKSVPPLSSKLLLPGYTPSPLPEEPTSLPFPALPTNIPEEKITISHPELIPESVIQEQVRILKIQPSQTEQALWTDNYRIPNIPQSISPEIEEEIKRRFSRVRARMERSQNPHFRQAARLIRELIAQGQFRFSPEIENTELSMSSIMTMYNTSEKIFYEVNVNLDHIVNKFDDISIAIALTHEMEHIKNMKNSVDSNPNKSPQESIAMYIRKQADRKNLIEEEVRGFAAGARAYIYEYGLLNGQGEIRSVHKELRTDALLFALVEQDEKNQDWQNHVEEKILLGQPQKN